ncbi:fumarylacetoacetate hydrolase family protein [Alteribacillus iranensis]|uniref:2-keto-4-pentenoate hydratase/2-oxohepta-3-ene-1,7-dioic acid hydratase (Catechol pathway) n=1 Tax=Alteribacillus iranensis TaxID=930128 RepID=A0A1I2DID2_9BACI|nr:fumarylacetoacetate hydrolase family protein [Alteribacillus iranensis]SFE80294.1 2-keto-4-pentenoate hydratase/2-oxohepta-3-ene-1,7-dioic acid hydratase (catechol pathway) [Alteribacillus iranensis]
MKLATINVNQQPKAAIIFKEGAVTIESINNKEEKAWKEDVFSIITHQQIEEIQTWYEDNKDTYRGEIVDISKEDYEPLYRHPSKIWGIGLNYVDHASDLSEKAPSTEPASFMKPDTTIIGPHDTIEIPVQSDRTTAEAELGLVIGKECKNVSEEEAIHYIAGYTTIIDMTAEDILQKNPRYLTRSKSFDTFFSFGPHLVTPDEVEDVHDLQVATVINGNIHRKNVVSNMTFTPWHLVSFHSQVMTLQPGDIISTGTPGAVPIQEGDIVECHIDGFEKLTNPVKDLKK